MARRAPQVPEAPPEPAEAAQRVAKVASGCQVWTAFSARKAALRWGRRLAKEIAAMQRTGLLDQRQLHQDEKNMSAFSNFFWKFFPKNIDSRLGEE